MTFEKVILGEMPVAEQAKTAYLLRLEKTQHSSDLSGYWADSFEFFPYACTSEIDCSSGT